MSQGKWAPKLGLSLGRVFGFAQERIQEQAGDRRKWLYWGGNVNNSVTASTEQGYPVGSYVESSSSADIFIPTFSYMQIKGQIIHKFLEKEW